MQTIYFSWKPRGIYFAGSRLLPQRTTYNNLAQPRKPGSFTSARRYSKDPGSLWSRELLKIRATRGPRGGWLKCDML
jgi:hypothetical protein